MCIGTYVELNLRAAVYYCLGKPGVSVHERTRLLEPVVTPLPLGCCVFSYNYRCFP